MTRKDYKVLAGAIREMQDNNLTKEEVIDKIAWVLKADNYRFDKDKFREACR